MRKFRTMVTACVLVIAGLSSFACGQEAVAEKNISVVIEYGDVRPARTVETAMRPGRTALEVLRAVATVETDRLDQYLFVTAIDGVRGRRGEMAWYYTIDGHNAEQMAAEKVLDARVGRITRTYRRDVCSATVDHQ